MPVELSACHLLCKHMSTWLYSEGSPPTELNQLWLNWINNQQLPTKAEINRAAGRSRRVGVPHA